LVQVRCRLVTNVAIYGSGGLGRVVRDVLLAGQRHRVVAFLDSDEARHGTKVDGLDVCAGAEHVNRLLKDGQIGVVVAIGDNHTRVAIAEQLRQHGVPLISAIHPLATVAPSARLGDHLIIAARATVCVHAEIASHCVISTGAIVEHDNCLECGVFLHPAVRLAGGVTVQERATLGIGACVIPYRRIGHRALVEPGSVVIREVLPGTTVGGVPAARRADGPSRFVPGGLPAPPAHKP
jgi:sugar O-acyltransferase (sialic acid O-acetyltransferase NeuD family)